MIIKNSFQFSSPPTITIGFFDGVHLGHQALLKKLTSKEHLVITFQNHPRSVLYPLQPTRLLCTNAERLHLLEKFGVQNLLLLEFTLAFSKQTPEAFLSDLKKTTHFEALVLGYDSHLGFQREGNPSLIREIGTQLGFSVEYIEPVVVGGITVSSSAIRSLLQAGKREEAEKLLGHSLQEPQHINLT